MNSIGTRLFAAFLVIILLVILVVGFALIVLLRNNPIVERQALTRLNEVARVVVRQELIAPDLPRDEAGLRIRRIAESLDVRVLITAANGEVLADSRAPGEAALNFSNFRAARRDSAFPGAFVGRARDERGRVWLFVARAAGQERRLIFAEPQQQLPVLAFFRENLFLPLAEAGGVAALVAVILAVLIARSIALPLQKMAAVARGIERGDYSQAAPVRGPDEVRALGQALNSMSQQVQAAQHAQRDFLANVSHELKTPLTSIQGFAQSLLEGVADSPEAIKRASGIIYDEADRMRRLVEGLLDLARLDVGRRALDRAPLDLQTMLAAIVEKFSLRANEKGIRLRGDLPPSLPALIGDADRLAQVFTNLLDNALHHTPQGGSVSLMAAAGGGAVEVSVEDTGPGIPPADLGRIFERFYQVDKSRARSGGVGLGLAITKEIVEAHAGSLRAESQVGRGTKIIVRLPVAHPGDITVARKKK